jgi:Flp pilus assembly protein TadG
MNRSRRGSGLIEFAFGLSVMAVFFVGMAQLAYSLIVLNQLTTAVRAGARYASSAEFDEPAHKFTERVQNYVAFGTATPDDGGGSRAPGLQPHHVSVTWTRDAAGAPESITVCLQNYELPFFFRDRQLDGRPKATVQYAGAWSPQGLTLH